MEMYVMLCLTLFTIAFLVLTIYAIQTLVQLRRTARSVEILAQHLDNEVSKVDAVTGRMRDAALHFGDSVTTAATAAFGWISRIIRSRKSAGKKEPTNGGGGRDE